MCTSPLLDLSNELRSALSGYPVEELLEQFSVVPDRAPPQQDVISFVLCQWAELLWRDMGQLPPVDHEMVREVRQRMARAREALLRVHDAVTVLGSAVLGCGATDACSDVTKPAS